MPLPILLPAALFLGSAILIDLAGGSAKRRTKSIEVCTAQLRAMWIKEDGIIRVYHEVCGLDCARIVVECTDEAPSSIPGEFDGYPVLVRLNPTHQEIRDAHAKQDDEYGVVTGAAGIRGVPTFRSYTQQEMDAMRRDQAAQGMRFSSTAP